MVIFCPLFLITTIIIVDMGAVVKIHKRDVTFPFVPYECQVDYMTKVIEALDTQSDAALESPTGTGKTLSLLCSTLAWVQHAKTQLQPSFDAAVAGPSKNPSSLVPRIFYCSRTHSQLSQVVRELNKTVYKNVKVCTLGSRDQLCVHEQVAKEKDNQTKALRCRNLVAKKACHYYNQWNGMDLATLDMIYSENGNVLDIEDLAKVAKKNRQCPFFRSRQQQETAELVLLPYNYIIDPHLRSIHKIDLKNNIVIFDEAHNLEGVCEDSVSTSISTADVSFVIKELQFGLEKLVERNETVRAEMDASNAAFGSGMNKENEGPKQKEIEEKAVADVLEKIFALEEAMDTLFDKSDGFEEMKEHPGKVFPGRAMLDLMEQAGFRRENALQYSETLHAVGQFISEERAGEGVVNIKDRGKKLLEFCSFLNKVFAESFEAVAKRGITDKEVAGENFKVYAVKEGTKITFHYWCLSAGIAMRFLKSRGVLSIIVTSGTLAPLEHFTKNLGIPFRFTLQNKHAASSGQVKVLMVQNGNDKAPLNGSFNNRKSISYLHGVGEGVVKAAENVPDGVLVFFSSYKSMEDCMDKWKQRDAGALTIWERISRRKKVVIEPRSKTELVQCRVEFEQAITSKRGAIFFAVTRGKVSEGIDFSDCHSRAVVIIGIPYPPVFDVRVMLKRSFLVEKRKSDKEAMSSEQWYSTEGFRAVNQAIGRVLRHVNDYGVVVLLDSRFSAAPPSSFPRWVHNSFERVDTVNDAAVCIKKFFAVPGRGEARAPGLVQLHAPAGTREKKRGAAIDTTKTSTEPVSILEIASECSAVPVVQDEVVFVAAKPKGRLLTSLEDDYIREVPIVPSPSSPSPSAVPPKKRPPTVHPALDPSSLATNASKRPKLKANLRLGEENKVDAAGSSRTAPCEAKSCENKLSREELEERKKAFNAAASQAGVRVELRTWLAEYNTSRDSRLLVHRLVSRLLPQHDNVLRCCIFFVPDEVKVLIREEWKKRSMPE